MAELFSDKALQHWHYERLLPLRALRYSVREERQQDNRLEAAYEQLKQAELACEKPNCRCCTTWQRRMTFARRFRCRRMIWPEPIWKCICKRCRGSGPDFYKHCLIYIQKLAFRLNFSLPAPTKAGYIEAAMIS